MINSQCSKLIPIFFSLQSCELVSKCTLQHFRSMWISWISNITHVFFPIKCLRILGIGEKEMCAVVVWLFVNRCLHTEELQFVHISCWLQHAFDEQSRWFASKTQFLPTITKPLSILHKIFKKLANFTQKYRTNIFALGYNSLDREEKTVWEWEWGRERMFHVVNAHSVASVY